MIRREPFGGIIYDDKTGKVYTTDKYSFRALEMFTQEGLGRDDISKKLQKEFPHWKPDLNAMNEFFTMATSMFTDEILSVQRGGLLNNGSGIVPWGDDKETTHFIAPVIIFWIYTNKCNLQCIHCVQDSGEILKNELSVSECKKVIDEFHEMGVFELSFSGGEPTSRLDDLLQIGRYARDLGFKLSIATNGILASERNAKVLAESGFKYAQVSIEGPRATHDYIRGKGAYDRTLAGIRNLVRENFFVMLATTVSDFNKAEFEDVVELAKNLGVKGVRFVRFLPMGRGLKNLELFSISKEDELRVAEKLWRVKWKNQDQLMITFNKHYASYGMKVAPDASGLDSFNWKWDCPAGRMRASIMPNGDITACPLIGSLGLNGGNVRTHSFKELWEQGSFFGEFREEKEDCAGCPEWNICKGGCKAWSYAKHDRLGARDPLCFREIF